jgi:ABC-2 type transport system ATP-binding protein
MDRAAAVVLRLLDEQAVPSPEARRLTVPLTRSDQAVDVLLALREAGIGIESVAVDKPSLDEVFLALTGHGADDQTPATEPADDLTLEVTR